MLYSWLCQLGIVFVLAIIVARVYLADLACLISVAASLALLGTSLRSVPPWCLKANPELFIHVFFFSMPRSPTGLV